MICCLLSLKSNLTLNIMISSNIDITLVSYSVHAWAIVILLHLFLLSLLVFLLQNSQQRVLESFLVLGQSVDLPGEV